MTETDLFLTVLAYLLGSIPFGLLLTHFAGLGDIRNIGSGNIGATNVMRTGNKKLGIATLLLDALKGAIAVGLAHRYGTELGLITVSIAAVIGHILPIWLKGKGGKGVATALAVFCALSWQAFLCMAAIWIAVFLLWRMSSLASLISIASSLLWLPLFENSNQLWISIILTLIVTYRHKENIARIKAGEELGFKKNKTKT